MSYTTFHKIRPLENGDFLVVTKCSNDGAPPREWVMDYFRREFPLFNNRQREAALILCGLSSGDVYYSEKYKRLQRLASDYSMLVFEETGSKPYPIYSGLSREGYERDIEWSISFNKPVLFSSYEEYSESVNSGNLKAVNGYISYVDMQEPERKIKVKIRLNNGDWIKRITKNCKNIGVSCYEQEAQVIKKTQHEIEKLMKRIPQQYGAELVLI